MMLPKKGVIEARN